MRLTEQQQAWLVRSLLACLLIAVGLELTNRKSLERLDLLIYDLILPLQAPEMSDKIVTVAIDNTSINELGRWPWPRQLHADVLNRITEMSPLAVGIDILFPEPQETDADNALAKAIKDNQRTVLAIAPTQETPDSPISELLPIPVLASSAAALGHVDAELDIDGLSRQFYLYAGLSDPHWPSVALAMIKVSGNQLPHHIKSPSEIGNGWVRQKQVLIPFSAHDDQPKRISYAALLAGRIPPEAIRDKYVLIGMTATGGGDMISTPMYHSHERMPAVELIAQQLNALLQDKLLHNLSHYQQLSLTSTLILSCVLIIILAPLRLGLWPLLGVIVIVLSCSILLLIYPKVWFAPATTLVILMITWPLWSIWQHSLSARQTKTLKRQLDHQAQHHLITDLPNHIMLEKWLSDLTSTDTDNTMAGLFVFQFNWPEAASSIIARSTDDSILQTIANHLKKALASKHRLAHINGDNFAILITDQPDIHTIQYAANTLLDYFHVPLNNYDEEVTLVPHIGVSIWPVHGKDLLQKASTAMFKSRMDDNQTVCIYSEDIGKEIEASSQIEQAMSYALERNEFEMYYQAQVEASTGKLIGAEALLRWHNPKLGWINPEIFIPIAEQSGMINKIGDWVLKSACNQLKILKQEGLDSIRIAVNLSPLQFSNPQLVSNITAIILQTGITPKNLELEVTENALMHNLSSATQIMEQINDQGMSLALDDFGTGYSSLQYLQSFPLTRLKMDKCFTREIGKNTNADEIARSIIVLAKQLSLDVIAEGVETLEQAQFLRNNDCDELQGYLFSKPIPADEFMDLLRTETTL